MKNLHRLPFIILSVAWLSASMFSCGKNEADNEGTELDDTKVPTKGQNTLRVPSAEEVTGTWRVKDVYVDDLKVEDKDNDMQIILREDGTYAIKSSFQPEEKGTWKLSYGKTDILFKKEGSTAATFDYNYKISEKENNEMTVVTYDSDVSPTVETGVKVLVLERMPR